jgi:hypothetical protein
METNGGTQMVLRDLICQKVYGAIYRVHGLDPSRNQSLEWTSFLAACLQTDGVERSRGQLDYVYLARPLMETDWEIAPWVEVVLVVDLRDVGKDSADD